MAKLSQTCGENFHLFDCDKLSQVRIDIYYAATFNETGNDVLIFHTYKHHKTKQNLKRKSFIEHVLLQSHTIQTMTHRDRCSPL